MHVTSKFILKSTTIRLAIAKNLDGNKPLDGLNYASVLTFSWSVSSCYILAEDVVELAQVSECALWACHTIYTLSVRRLNKAIYEECGYGSAFSQAVHNSGIWVTLSNAERSAHFIHTGWTTTSEDAREITALTQTLHNCHVFVAGRDD